MNEESLSISCWECLITYVDQLGAEELNLGNILNQGGLIYCIFGGILIGLHVCLQIVINYCIKKNVVRH